MFDYGSIFLFDTLDKSKTAVGFWHMEESVLIARISSKISLPPITPGIAAQQLKIKVSATLTEKA